MQSDCGFAAVQSSCHRAVRILVAGIHMLVDLYFSWFIRHISAHVFMFDIITRVYTLHTLRIS
jgi:hypothetical protein